MTLLDQSTAPRAGEELDEPRLRAYLRAEVPALFDGVAAAAPIGITQFPGGYSNLTYLLEVGGRELVLRRPPFGSKVKTAHDMGREYRILSRLVNVYPKVPRPLVYCEDEAVLGAKFYVMERIAGVILRQKVPRELALPPERMRALCEALCDTLVDLHAIDYQAVGLLDLGKPEGYVERQVSGWTQRYKAAQTDDIAAMERVCAWLAANLPPSPAPTLLHNDYKFDNLVLDPAEPTRIVGLLDWEMATLGDPLMDVGTMLCYWVQADDPPALQAARFGPTALPGSLLRRELAARYAARSGRDLSHVVFYYCFGLMKTVGVVQQIYYRYKQGLTQDARFAGLGLMARTLAEQAERAIDAGAI